MQNYQRALAAITGGFFKEDEPEVWVILESLARASGIPIHGHAEARKNAEELFARGYALDGSYPLFTLTYHPRISILVWPKVPTHVVENALY